MPRRTGLATAVAWGWTAMIVVACWLPKDRMPEDETEFLTFRVPGLDKLIHASLFAGFGYFWLQVRTHSRRRTAAIVCLGLALGALTELGQESELVGRDANLFDALADYLGLLLGVGGTLWLDRRRKVARVE